METFHFFFKKKNNFLQTLLGGPWGPVWVSGGQFGLTCLSIRLHGVFLSHPDSCSGQFWPKWANKTARLRAKLTVFLAQNGEFQSRARRFLSKKCAFFGKDGPSPRYTRPSWDARGYTHPSWKGDSHRRLATDPLRGSGPWMAQVDGRWTICNGSTTWIQP